MIYHPEMAEYARQLGYQVNENSTQSAESYSKGNVRIWATRRGYTWAQIEFTGGAVRYTNHEFNMDLKDALEKERNMNEGLQEKLMRICACCGFKMTEAEAKKNEVTGLCFDCIVASEDGSLEHMNRPDSWAEWSRAVYPDEGGKPVNRNQIRTVEEY